MKRYETDHELGKLPPQAIDVEQAVLGALMLEAEAYESIKGIVQAQSFYKDEHRIIFEIIQSLSSEGKPVDLLIVTQELKDKNLLEEVGGPLYITKLTNHVASAAHSEHHARIIAEKYFQREIIRKSSEILKLAYQDEDVDVLGRVWREYGNSLEDIFTVANTGSLMSAVLKDTVREIEADCTKSNKSETPGIPTGLSSLDNNTGGWRPGNLIILAARPGIGKTSFALFFAVEAARAGYWVNLFSLEMNKEDLARIIISAKTGIYRSNIRDGYLKPEDWLNINSAIAELEKLPIIFRDSSGLNVQQIQSAIRKNRKNGMCDFALVDYLQLVKSSQPKAIRELEVSEISRTLKTTGLNENIPILALSQLNRSAENEVPRLSHLRESGAIEQDADIVCFLHKSKEKPANYIQFLISKHRRGRLGYVDVFSNDEMTRFSENQHEFTGVAPDYNPNHTIEPENEPF